MNKPEFKSEEIEDLSPDDISSKVIEEVRKESEPEFDEIGNSLNVGNGLEPSDRIINVNVTSGSVPNTRPDKWTTTTKRKMGKYGLIENTLSYKNNFPYDANYLAEVKAKDTLESKVSSMVRNPRPEALRSQIVLPKDESQFKEGYKFMDRAIATIRNQVANENKNLLDIHAIDSREVKKRGSKEIHRVMPTEIEVKEMPDIISVNSDRDAPLARYNSRKLDHSNHLIDQMKTNYNFK